MHIYQSLIDLAINKNCLKNKQSKSIQEVAKY